LPPLQAGGGEATVSFELDWSALGPESWWWPNKPFNASYEAQLHWLNLSLSSAASGQLLSRAQHRFGFVEHAEGASFYTLNGLRNNMLSDATPEAGMSWYDAYSKPAFQHSAAGSSNSSGAAASWRSYMALGLSACRLHQSTPTAAMLQAADEVGFLLKPESPIRGACSYEPCPGSSAPGFAQSMAELARACRGHPSVVAYSLENESSEQSSAASFFGALIDAAAAEDASVPFTTEGSPGSSAVPVVYNGSSSGRHGVNMAHYSVPAVGSSFISGVGECAWCVANGLEQFSSLALQGRLAGMAYYAGWDLLNYWSNLLQGASAAQHAWQQRPCQGRDRQPGLDGWGSEVVGWVQRAFHPFLVLDVQAAAANPIYAGPGWPYSVRRLAPGANATVSAVLFHDVLAGSSRPWEASSWLLTLEWQVQWDSGGQGGQPVAGCSSSGRQAVAVQPGWQAQVAGVGCERVPEAGGGGGGGSSGSGGGGGGGSRRLYTVLRSLDAGGVVRYVEDRVYALVEW
jgi:hypothetical protein